MAKAYLRVKYHKAGNVYLGIPHRLDRPVSGVVVFAAAMPRAALSQGESAGRDAYYSLRTVFVPPNLLRGSTMPMPVKLMGAIGASPPPTPKTWS